MNRMLSIDEPSTGLPDTGQRGVWDRFWKHRPSAEKDDALLARESRGPRFQLVLDRLKSTFGSIKGLRTVELGSGRGDLSALLVKEGAEATLLDRSESALNEAKWRFDRLGLNARFDIGDITGSLEPWRDRFDVAMSLGVIEHFQDDQRTQVIRAHHDVLKPGGLAIISAPNAWCIPYRVWKFYLQHRGWWPYGMELPYTKDELVNRAHRAGFARAVIHALGFWQSIGDYWGPMLLKRKPDWWNRRSVLDAWAGVVLLLFAWRGQSRIHVEHDYPVHAESELISGNEAPTDTEVALR
ncbi:MAG: class I SAM-dependent methyltransferase [Phycisphaerales bacterium]|nr:MAG: class I SAM-dependent methyltransferase [Phycisphaerales bacterium]